MSARQQEASRTSVLHRTHERVAQVYPTLPQRFTTKEAMRAAKLAGCAGMYSLIYTLETSFKCQRTVKGIWVKPAAGGAP